MGVSLGEFVEKKPITLEDLSGKTLVVDTYNLLYQFLSNIRLRDGALLTDAKGNVTSHLNGLFSRTTNLMQKGICLIFVLDGEPPKLKVKERDRRKALKLEAMEQYRAAVQREDMEEMRKYASRTSRLTSDMVAEAEKLVIALGLPVVHAPSEGEAQAAYMVKKGDAFAEVSEDYDCLLFGVPRLIKNLSITGRKKQPNKFIYGKTSPEMIDLDGTLKKLSINADQLIALGLLIGTDYNRKGIPGIGPKKGLKLVQKYSTDFEKLFEDSKWGSHYDFPWTEAFDLIKNMPVTSDYKLRWSPIDRNAVIHLLCEEHGFALDRVENTLDKVAGHKMEKAQKGLKDFF